eukprot:TRINITY_DN1812_c0_g1_i6.p2 TRINITY_DN1812_c0_g1~~TRINITY_DN1812_c0_g1_i6.p2  ORF type:complete len:197 (-),score=38.27 TRINITY_DN1812_c0_g1_i6:144-734(-)
MQHDPSCQHQSLVHPAAPAPSSRPSLSIGLALGVPSLLIMLMAPGHQTYKRYHNYLEYPAGFNVVFIVHVCFGITMQLCGALQFWPWLRKEHRAVHRLTGRIYFVCLCMLLLTATVLLPLQIQKKYESGHFGLKGWYYNVGLYICAVVTGGFGYGHILRGNWVRHRCWMLRNYAVISSVGVFDICLLYTSPSPRDS